MTVKIALLGFGTVASGVPFLLKENGDKIFQAAQSEIEVAKVLVKDEEEKARNSSGVTAWKWVKSKRRTSTSLRDPA